jgi:AraC-like DNA-binding protein
MILGAIHIVSLIAMFQALLMALFFFLNKKNSRISNVTLATMLLAFAILIGCSMIMNLDNVKSGYGLQKLVFVLSFSSFLIGPLLLLYVRSLLDTNYKLQWRDGVHFLPFVLGVFIAAIYMVSVKQFLIWTYDGRLLMSTTVLIQNILYFVVAVQEMRLHGLTIRLFISYINNSRLAWLRFFCVGYIALWLVQLQFFIGWDVLRHPVWCPYGTSLYFVSTFLFFNAMVLVVLKNPEAFSQTQKYQASGLKPSEKESYRQKLLPLMEKEKLYLNSMLTLPDLAQKMNISPAHLSQIINELFHQHFTDFLNKYRIEESKAILQKNEQRWNISEIALESGFNSKSTFNSAFKKHTGITPKEFKHTMMVKAAKEAAQVETATPRKNEALTTSYRTL